VTTIPAATTHSDPLPTERDPRWAAVIARDPAADGRFYYSVSTTGVYCRPSCAARLARPEHVRFHDTAADAERAGFRACKRCGRAAAAPAPRRTPETLRFAVAPSSLGAVIVAESAAGVTAVLLGDTAAALRDDLAARFPGALLVEGDEAMQARANRVAAFVGAPAGGLDLPLDARGTPFQRRVWEALRAIPAGSTATYTELAERIGAPTAVRAVAAACAANPLAVVVPCHRVVRQDGGLSGYRWGVERKRALLGLEGAR